MSLLELRGVAAGYGDVDIVSCIDIMVDASEIVTICGTNGAGKSTITKAIMGLTPRCKGSITIGGHDLMQRRTDERIGLGIGYVPQVSNVFPSLTVLENLQIVPGVGKQRERITQMFDMFPLLVGRRNMKAGGLSGGERQQLALARAMMSRPHLIILDEPTAALSPIATSQVFELIRQLPQTGAAVLIVEQRARQSLEVSHRGYILDAGRIVMSGASAALLSDPMMVDLYLGRADLGPSKSAALSLSAAGGRS